MSTVSDSTSLTELDSDTLRPHTPDPEPPHIYPEIVDPSPTQKGRVRKRKAKISIVTDANKTVTTAIVESVETDIVAESKQKRKRRKKEKKPIMPLAPRIPSILKIGAHVSAAGGVQNAIANSLHIG